jgi:murein tripeptide amidase MpaA
MSRTKDQLLDTAAAADFPTYDSGYHNYAEMVDQIQAVAADHPDIVQVSSIGKSYQGRELWAAKVSDNVADDEAEPEVLLDGATTPASTSRWRDTGHPRLWPMAWKRPQTDVDSREVWIVFSVNPDGAEYDIRNGEYHLWRKNRQPTPGSSKIGTDLNRNYDYRWGCCGGSSSPGSLTYRAEALLGTGDARHA